MKKGENMKRGEREQVCLETVKKIVFYNNGKIRCDLDGKSCLDVSDEEFFKFPIWYFDFPNNAFGLSEEDRSEVANLLRTAQPNEKASEFPDFVFENGFIEHFQITASKETKKGSQQIIKENDFSRRAEKNEKIFKEECKNNPDFVNVRSVTTAMNFPDYSGKNLESSFKRNFEHHIQSLEKYNGSKQIGVFMVENYVYAVNMYENIFADVKENVSYGDLRRPQEFSCYRLSRDKNLLNYIYSYRDLIRYIIFVYEEYTRREKAKGFEGLFGDLVRKIEVIKVENIPYMLKLLPWNFDICPLFGGAVRSIHSISSKKNEALQ